MARVPQGVEKGLRIFLENSNTFVDILAGTAAPTGTGDQASAPIGSLYVRIGTGELYQKIANAAAPADWELNGSSSVAIGKWRPENVVALTNDVVAAGTIDYSVNPFSDDDGPLLPADFVVGKYVIGDADGTPALFEITGQSGNNVTFAAASNPLVAEDTFIVNHYLPDPAGQENKAIVNFNGSVMLKLSDIDWEFANAISLTVGYTATNGTISSADSVESAIEKLDGNQQDIQSSLGVAQGSIDLGTFTGVTIPDNVTVKSALQSLETAHEEVDQNVNDLITLSGVAENATDLGTFTGDIIPDSSNNKQALQSLETELVDTRDNTDDLITLSGVAENSTVLGAFAAAGSIFLGAALSVKGALQALADLLAQLRGVQVTGLTTLAAVDSVPHASVKACKWLVEVFQEGTPANRQAFEVFALTDGSSVDDTLYAKLKLGANISGLSFSVAINGANMELRAASSVAVTVTARRIEVVKNVL